MSIEKDQNNNVEMDYSRLGDATFHLANKDESIAVFQLYRDSVRGAFGVGDPSLVGKEQNHAFRDAVKVISDFIKQDDFAENIKSVDVITKFDKNLDLSKFESQAYKENDYYANLSTMITDKMNDMPVIIVQAKTEAMPAIKERIVDMNEGLAEVGLNSIRNRHENTIFEKFKLSANEKDFLGLAVIKPSDPIKLDILQNDEFSEVAKQATLSTYILDGGKNFTADLDVLTTPKSVDDVINKFRKVGVDETRLNTLSETFKDIIKSGPVVLAEVSYPEALNKIKSNMDEFSRNINGYGLAEHAVAHARYKAAEDLSFKIPDPVMASRVKSSNYNQIFDNENTLLVSIQLTKDDRNAYLSENLVKDLDDKLKNSAGQLGLMYEKISNIPALSTPRERVNELFDTIIRQNKVFEDDKKFDFKAVVNDLNTLNKQMGQELTAAFNHDLILSHVQNPLSNRFNMLEKLDKHYVNAYMKAASEPQFREPNLNTALTHEISVAESGKHEKATTGLRGLINTAAKSISEQIQKYEGSKMQEGVNNLLGHLQEIKHSRMFNTAKELINDAMKKPENEARQEHKNSDQFKPKP